VRARLGLLDAGSQRIIRAVAFGLPTDSAALLDATGATTAEVDDALDAAQHVGLLHGDATPVECIAAALRTETPRSERDRIALAAVSCGGAGAITAVATHLAAVEARSTAAAQAYVRAGDHLQAVEPEQALTFFDLAVECGEPLPSVLPSLVACAAAGGQPRRAVELAATARTSMELGGGARAEVQRAAGVAWAQLGRPDLAAACLVEAGETNLAVLALVAAGDAGGAAGLDLGPPSPTDPTTLAAHGALAWARGNAQAATDALDRGAAMTEVTGVRGWPDSAHALGALLALLALDGRSARRLAGTAVATHVGGAAFRDRHQLLLGWAALRAGQADEAHAALQAVERLPLVPRDRLLALGLRAALTLRFGDPAELSELHEASIDARGQSTLEVYALDVAAELACLAARVGAPADSLLAPAERAADALGRPVTLTVPLAWARLVVALTVDDAAAARAAAADLTDLAEGTGSGPSAELARAATTVADVLDGVVDADEVRAVAELLTAKGRVFEASRLVGAAALRTTDTTLARSLLGELRRLKATQIRPAGGRDRAVAALSEREREVARLVLDGRTHREIGTELYISAKTVEHHVANVRQKLGATTRSELLAAIRDELART
jgi:DNA-binding CsgD family transcriptional regulator